MNPRFMTNIVYRSDELKFWPSYERLRDLIITTCEMIEEIPLNTKRIEHSLYEKTHTAIFLEVRLIQYIKLIKSYVHKFFSF